MRERSVTQRPDQAWIKNRLLRAMAPADFDLLRPHLDPVVLPRKLVLISPQRLIEHLYFPESGIASLTAGAPDEERIEIGLAGPEGMTGIPVLLFADRSPCEAFIQVPGHGFRIASAQMRAAIDGSATLNALLLRYVQATQVQLAYTALAHGSYNLVVRLARWLVMCQDRVGSDELPLVHEFIALMLGVRRAGVTETLHILEGGGMIKATRGQVTIRDRAKLVETASSSYGVPEAEYERLIAGAGSADWRSL
jgi:CRP-like cAMP-binding protein